MSITDLPNEILARVLQLVPPSNHKTLSLVCKSFESTITPSVFSEVNIWIGLHDLRRLFNIANSARAGQHLQTLVIQDGMIHKFPSDPVGFLWDFQRMYDPAILNSTGTQRGGSEGSDTVEPFRNASIADFQDISPGIRDLGWTSQSLFDKYKAYGDVLVDHQEMLASGMDIEMLSSVMDKLPKLSNVIFRNWRNGTKKWLPSTEARGQPTKVRVRQLEYPVLSTAINTFLKAVAASKNLQLSKFTIEDDFYDTPVGEDGFVHVDPDTIEAALPVLKSITSIGLPVTLDSGMRDHTRFDRWSRAEYHWQQTAFFLGGLSNLQHLHIYSTRESLCTQFERSIGNALTCKALKKIDLTRFSITIEAMAKMCQTYSRSLKEIRLTQITLFGGGHFEEFFTLIRNTLNLDKFVLAGGLLEELRFPGSYQNYVTVNVAEAETLDDRQNLARKAIQDFVLKRTESFPRDLLDLDSSQISFEDFKGRYHNRLQVLAEVEVEEEEGTTSSDSD